jgi:Arc/MetJ family transcription regulator
VSAYDDHVKTTIDIADPLLAEAKEIAARRHTTVRALVEDGLRRVLDEERERERKPFRLRDGSVSGRGLKPEFAGASWDKILDAIYEGR